MKLPLTDGTTRDVKGVHLVDTHNAPEPRALRRLNQPTVIVLILAVYMVLCILVFALR